MSSQSSGEPGVNADFGINQAALHTIGKYSGGTKYFNGYMAEVHFVDGTSLAPTSFGEVNEDTNQWVPIKYAGTYGTNGFYLKTQDSSDFGDDSSGNGNDWTDSGFAASDQVTDSPTNNFATLNSCVRPYAGITYSEGDMKFTNASGSHNIFALTIPLTSGKWYYEFKPTAGGAAMQWGVYSNANDYAWSSDLNPQEYASIVYYGSNGEKRIDGTFTTYGASYANDDILGCALDLDRRPQTVTYYKNGVSQGAISFTGVLATSRSRQIICAGTEAGGAGIINCGQDGTFIGTETAQGNSDGNAVGNFYYAVPANHLAICSNNLPDPTIEFPTSHFATTTYTGNGTAIGSGGKTITGLSFQPDFVWFKGRSGGYSHDVFDSIRGATKKLNPDDAGAEGTQTEGLTAFTSDGFTFGNQDNCNTNAATYVAWSWLGAASNATNTDGTITSTIRANPTAGFSFGTYTGNNTTGGTIGHGLSEAPEFVMVKNRDSTPGFSGGPGFPSANTIPNWAYYSQWDIAGAASYNLGFWNNVAPSSSVITFGNINNTNGTDDYVFWAWHSVPGYSQVGGYMGNGNNDGPFVYTGFRPMYIWTKKMTNPAAESWFMMDNERWYAANAPTAGGAWLTINNATAETTTNDKPFDFLSNGFKPRDNSGYFNDDAYAYLYIAIAGQSFKYSNASPSLVPSQI